MIYAYIAVALVVGLLVGLAALAVAWLAKSVGKSIQTRTLELVSAYDDILEQRSRELAWMEQKKNSVQEQPRPEIKQEPRPQTGAREAAARTALLGAVERISSAQYRDNGAARLYRKIRTEFGFSPAEALARIPREELDCRPGPATCLLKDLSFETVFTLSTLPEEEQYRLLMETLAPEQTKLVQEYRDQLGGFKSLGFYDFLREKADGEPHPPRLRVSPMTVCQGIPHQVEIVEDPAICEGFLLESGNYVYDYCIKTREIG